MSSILIQVVTCSNPLFGHRRHRVPSPRSNRGKILMKNHQKNWQFEQKTLQNCLNYPISFSSNFLLKTPVFLSIIFTSVHSLAEKMERQYGDCHTDGQLNGDAIYKYRYASAHLGTRATERALGDRQWCSSAPPGRSIACYNKPKQGTSVIVVTYSDLRG